VLDPDEVDYFGFEMMDFGYECELCGYMVEPGESELGVFERGNRCADRAACLARVEATR
jgi:hypothetical protein